MSMNEEKQFIDYLYRKKYPRSKKLLFRDLVKEAIRLFSNADEIEIDRLTESKEGKLWNKLKREIDSDRKRGIVPVFEILSSEKKLVKWIGLDELEENIRQAWKYEIRPNLYNLIDTLDSREYEALACVICKLFGAQNIFLTAPGNEGGIDFIASLGFPKKAHFILGMKGPIRIIGQCKKYATKDSVGHMKEFVQTLNDIHNGAFRAGAILPAWFVNGAGPILGWHIANSGHQAGAVDYAKHYGIMISDTKEIIDLICTLRCPKEDVSNSNKIDYIASEIQDFLTYPMCYQGKFQIGINF